MESSSSRVAAEELRRAYETVLSLARRLEGRVSVADGTVIAYTRGAEPPASILYISSLHAGLDVALASATELSLHIVPYRELRSAVIFSYKQRDSRAVSSAIASSIMGAKTVLVSPTMPEAYEEKLRIHGVERVAVDSPSPLLAMSVAAALWSPRMMGAREERVRAELRALDTALDWVLEKYSFVAERGYETAVYSPATAAGAYYYCASTRSCAPLPLDALEDYVPRGRLLAMLTTLERREYEESLRAAKSKTEVDVVEFNVDPVTASLYSVLVALVAARRAI
ncbi:MAG: hypothetical protein QXS85_04040 [Acidilobaceae archaeon]